MLLASPFLNKKDSGSMYYNFRNKIENEEEEKKKKKKRKICNEISEIVGV